MVRYLPVIWFLYILPTSNQISVPELLLGLRNTSRTNWSPIEVKKQGWELGLKAGFYNLGIKHTGEKRQQNSIYLGLLSHVKSSSIMTYLCAGNNVQFQLLVNKASTSLRQISLVEDKAVSPKTARATEFLQPLGPLWVQLPIRLFILGFEHTNDFLEEGERNKRKRWVNVSQAKPCMSLQVQLPTSQDASSWQRDQYWREKEV